MINTILFDMGGTLEDISYSEETENLAINKVLEILDREGLAPMESFEETKSKIMRGIFAYKEWSERTKRELKPEEIWTDYYFKDYNFPREHIAQISEEMAGMWEVTYYKRKLRDNVIETLRTLENRGYKLGVISNTSSLYSVYDVLEGYGIRAYTKEVVLSSITGYRKPHKEIFNIALREIHSEADNCAYVGDTVSRDIMGAKSAGFNTAIQIKSFLTGEKDKNIKDGFMPDFIIQSIFDLIDIFSDIQS